MVPSVMDGRRAMAKMPMTITGRKYWNRANLVTIGFGVLCLSALAVLLVVRASSVNDDVSPVVSASSPSSPSSSSTRPDNFPDTSTVGATHQWHFDTKRDEYNYGLSEEQCDQAFPGLYQEIGRAANVRKKGNSIRQSDVKFCGAHPGGRARNHTQIHVLIHSGQVRIVNFQRGWQRMVRPKSTLSSIFRAVNGVDPKSLPNIEFIVDVEDIGFQTDCPNRPAWVYCRHVESKQRNLWVMPDYDGWSYKDPVIGSYMSFREKVQQLEEPYSEKVAKLIWRGNTEIAKNIRGSLVDLTKGKSWADVASVNWYTRENVIKMEDFCRYQFNVHTQGVSWSGRLRYIQNCHTAIFVHPLDWIAHYYPLLQANMTGPHQTYIPVARDFRDLERKMDHHLNTKEGIEEAERIADNNVATYRDRYLTPAAEACYWRRMIKAYAEVQGFEPELWKIDENGKRDYRGISFEHWLTRDLDDASVLQEIDG